MLSIILKRNDAFLFIYQTQALHPIEVPIQANEPPGLFPSGTYYKLEINKYKKSF